MYKIRKNKGITLISLVITIIVLVILASVATYSGVSTIQSSKFTKFETELRIMQTQVNSLYEKDKNATLGKEIDTNNTQASKVFTANESGITDKTGYMYFDKETIKSLNIEGVEGEYFVNLQKRSVVSYEGFTYKGITYYTIEQIIPNGLNNVEYNANTVKPTFDVKYENIENGKVRVTIYNIQYEGNINKWQVMYQENGKDYWNTSEDLSFIIEKDGKYNIKIANNAVESEVVTKIIATHVSSTDGLIRYYDAINNTGEGDSKHNKDTTTWKNLSGNCEGIIKGGAIINDNYISLDGTDDWINAGEINAKNVITIETTIMPKTIISGDEYIMGNWENGGMRNTFGKWKTNYGSIC